MSARIIASDAEALAVARDVASRLAPGAADRDRSPALPVAELDTLSASGLLSITVPRGHGGADVSFETVARVFQLLAAADPAIAQLPQSHFVFVEALRQDGTAEQQDFFFGAILAGARLGNAQAERGSTSPLDLKTRLTRAPGGYRLNGTKYYCTGAAVAHWIPVAALDDEDRLVLAHVPREARGVTVLADWNAMGQRATFSGTVVLEDVLVPERHVVTHWRLFERPSLLHAYAALLHAAIDVGIAENALADTVTAIRARRRPRLGAAVARTDQDPLLLLRLGQLSARFHAAEGLLLRAARLLDAAGPAVDRENEALATVAVCEAKAFGEEAALEIASELFALLGSSATDDALNLHRHWRNARAHTVHDANQWRYHAAGNYLLNGMPPAKPLRRPVEVPAIKEAADR